MVCTFFGHSNTPVSIYPKLYSTLDNLIKENNVNKFYVGNQGNFDFAVIRCLKELKINHPNIEYNIVLAYFPKKTNAHFCSFDFSDTIFPQGFEYIHPKYAIDKRNRWMIENSDLVVTYVTREIGGAAKYKAIAEKKGKPVINISNND